MGQKIVWRSAGSCPGSLGKLVRCRTPTPFPREKGDLLYGSRGTGCPHPPAPLMASPTLREWLRSGHASPQGEEEPKPGHPLYPSKTRLSEIPFLEGRNLE